MVTINIEKKSFMIFGMIILAVFVISYAIAVWNPGEHPMSHDSDDIKLTVSGVEYSLQEAIDNARVEVNYSDCERITFSRSDNADWLAHTCPDGKVLVGGGGCGGDYCGGLVAARCCTLFLNMTV
jgi:hypothetical protein